MKKIFLLLFLIPGLQTLRAQSRFSVSVPDSLAFILFINDQKINNVLCTAITVESVPAGKVNVKMICGKHAVSEVNQLINLKDLSLTSFELRKIKGEYKLAMVSESKVAFIETPSVASTVPDTVPMIATPDYSGNTGCDRATDAQEFNRLNSELADSPFEAQKINNIKNFLNNNCLRVDQLRILLSLLELEENKLKLVEAAMGHIYDLDHLKTIEDVFFLEKNKEKVREMSVY